VRLIKKLWQRASSVPCLTVTDDIVMVVLMEDKNAAEHVWGGVLILGITLALVGM
jgi:hypothetical protein